MSWADLGGDWAGSVHPFVDETIDQDTAAVKLPVDYESSTMFFYLSRFLHIDAYFGYILINFRSSQKRCSGQICSLSGATYLQLKRNIEKSMEGLW